MKRESFLSEIMANRGKRGRARYTEVYLDESYIWQHHRRKQSFVLQDEDVNCGRVKTKGNRVIGIFAISKKGPVRDSLLTYECQKRTGDYHGNINTDIFMKWATEYLFPNLPSKCLLILDNAKYHHNKEKSVISKARNKMNRSEIMQWLKDNDVPFVEENSTTALTLLMSQKLKMIPSAFEVAANAKGHKVLWLPPYHPEFNPIEMIWGITKGEVAAQYESDVTMSLTLERWRCAFQNLSDNTVIRTVEHAQTDQQKAWDDLLKEARSDTPYSPEDDSDKGESSEDSLSYCSSSGDSDLDLD
eukprot:Nk52_evm91s2367 gene=Nk52_evmTU91s2367